MKLKFGQNITNKIVHYKCKIILKLYIWIKRYGNVKMGVVKGVDFERRWSQHRVGPLPTRLPRLFSLPKSSIMLIYAKTLCKFEFSPSRESANYKMCLFLFRQIFAQFPDLNDAQMLLHIKMFSLQLTN